MRFWRARPLLGLAGLGPRVGECGCENGMGRSPEHGVLPHARIRDSTDKQLTHCCCGKGLGLPA